MMWRFSLCLVVSILTGCQLNEPVPWSDHDAVGAIATARDHLLTQEHVTMREARYPVITDDGIWVATKTIVADSQLPALMSEPVTLIRGDSMNLADLSAYLKSTTGLEVTRSDELVPKLQVSKSISIEEIETETPQAGEVHPFIPTPAVVMNFQQVPLEDVLDQIASAMGISWRFVNGAVHFYYYETETFVLINSPAKTELTITSTNQSSTQGKQDGQSQSAETSQFVSYDVLNEFWPMTESAVQAMLSVYGRAVVNAATGHIVVTDNPAVLRQISDYVEDVNVMLSLQAHAKLTLIRLTQRDRKSFGINYQLLYRAVDDLSLGLTTPRAVSADQANLSIGATDPDSRFFNSAMFIDALSQQGSVSIVRSHDLTFRNFSPLQWKKGDTIRYLSAASTTNTAAVGSTESNEITSLFTGTGISLYPYIVDSENIVLDIAISQTSVVEFLDIPLGDVVAQVPQTTGEDEVLRHALRNGETRIIMAYDATATQSGRSDLTGSCVPWCNTADDQTREYILYLLTVSMI